MIRSFKPITFLIILMVAPPKLFLIGQTNPLTDIQRKFLHYTDILPREEVYVHTDRDSYVAGEDLWFNIYVFDRKSSKPSDRSRIAYFELLNADNVPVLQKPVKIENGFGPAHGLIPDTLKTGNYTIRAYTSWMKNFLPGNSFTRNINIYNSLNTKTFKKKIVFEKQYNRRINIEFYPEGGSLIDGVLSRVAVMVFDEHHRGIVYSGKVVDEKGDSVVSFKTDKFGTGAFDILPIKGKSYSSTARSLNESYLSLLPGVSDSGYNLKVNNQNEDTLIISIRRGTKEAVAGDNNLVLLIQTNGRIDFINTFWITGDITKIRIPGTNISDGINQICLFNTAGRLLSERLIYSTTKSSPGISSTLTENIKARNKISMDIKLDSQLFSSPKRTNISISVSPKIENSLNRNLSDYMVFGTEYGRLPWEIDTGTSLDKLPSGTIDNFLISARSSWIDWNVVFSGKFPELKYKFETDSYYLHGRLADRNTQDPDSERVVFLSIPGKEAFFEYSRTNKKGEFCFTLPIDELQRDLIIQPEAVNNNYSIMIDPPFSDRSMKAYYYTDTISNEILPQISKLSVNYQVAKIYRTNSVIDTSIFTKPDVSSKRFYGKPDIEMIMDDFIKLPVMQEVFFELLQGVKLKSKGTIYEIQILNPVDNVIYNKPPLVMIDGVIINDISLVANLDPETVKKIDVIKTIYIVGDYHFYGIVNVITKAGNYGNITLPDNVVRIPYKVLDHTLSFTSPDYSAEAFRKSRKPDFRNTLYWNPSLKPDKNGRMSITFWASDLPSEYVISIQGITDKGMTVRFEKSFSIGKP